LSILFILTFYIYYTSINFVKSSLTN